MIADYQIKSGAVEQEARHRKCSQMIVMTHSFQAPEFYAKHGFQLLATIDDYPRGHGELILRKTLSTEA